MSQKIQFELWAARIPGIGRMADHHWLVIHRDGVPERWEVWQSKQAGGESWGHLHRDLKHPFAGVGNGPGRCLHRWEFDLATELAERVLQSPTTYPWRNAYFIWPGPNSNTFVQWILKDVHRLGPRGCGKHFDRLFGWWR